MNLSIRKQPTEAYASRCCRLGTPARGLWHIDWRKRRKRSKKNERTLSWTVRAPDRLKQLQHICFDGLAERKTVCKKKLKTGEKMESHSGERIFSFVWEGREAQGRDAVVRDWESQQRVQLFTWCGPRILLSIPHQSGPKLVKHLRGRDYMTVGLPALHFLQQKKDFRTRSGH